ncbi:hypothetical protein NC652_034228 [Populus alba x Populus x berolinensis]|nr:hypothetical protein NC652_034228 [Populus alba x Populus x berolinensis]
MTCEDLTGPALTWGCSNDGGMLAVVHHGVGFNPSPWSFEHWKSPPLLYAYFSPFISKESSQLELHDHTKPSSTGKSSDHHA